MISSIEISNFRGIREGKLEDLTPLTVLVGPNGSGKSAVLDAMLVGASLTPGKAIQQTAFRHEDVVEKGRWLFWRGERGISEAKIAVCTDDGAIRTSTLTIAPSLTQDRSRDPNVITLIWQPEAPAQQTQAPPANRRSGGSGMFGGGRLPATRGNEARVQFGRERTADQVSGTAPALSGVPEIRLVEIRGDGHSVPLHELYSESARTGQREITKALITDLLPQIKDIEILTEASQPVLYLVLEDRAVPVALSGDGVHALVRIALELASRPNGVVLLEEPEVHQHPGAMRQTVRAILAAVRRNIQVVLTTHSLEFIDILLAEASEEDITKLSLYRLELEKGRLIAVRTPGSEVAFSRGEIEEDLR